MNGLKKEPRASTQDFDWKDRKTNEKNRDRTNGLVSYQIPKEKEEKIGSFGSDSFLRLSGVLFDGV